MIWTFYIPGQSWGKQNFLCKRPDLTNNILTRKLNTYCHGTFFLHFGNAIIGQSSKIDNGWTEQSYLCLAQNRKLLTIPALIWWKLSLNLDIVGNFISIINYIFAVNTKEKEAKKEMSPSHKLESRPPTRMVGPPTI